MDLPLLSSPRCKAVARPNAFTKHRHSRPSSLLHLRLESLPARSDPGRPTRQKKANAQIDVMRRVRITRKPARIPASRDNLRKRTFNRLHNLGMVYAAQMPHRLRQVARRNEENIYMVDSEDLSQVIDRNDILDQHNHQRLVVGPVNIVRARRIPGGSCTCPACLPDETWPHSTTALASSAVLTCGTTIPCAPRSNVR